MRVARARKSLLDHDALTAARLNQPLPVGYKLPVLSKLTHDVYDALRNDVPVEEIASV